MGTKGLTKKTLGKKYGQKFTQRQVRAIELLATGASIKDCLAKVGVSQPTLYRWRRNPLFMDAVTQSARDQLHDILPSVYRQIAKQAATGDYQFCKLLLDHLDKLEDMKSKATQGTISFTWETPSCQQ